MSVSFLDLTSSHRELRPALDAAFARVVDSGRFILGPEVEAFEEEFASHCDSAHVVGVGNGLDAIEIALRARGVGPGDEVIVPAHTFIATWLAVARCGASVVPADVDPDTLLLTPAMARSAIGPRTAAILPVHLYGLPCDMAAMSQVASDHGLALIADAAQAAGARYAGRPVGALGDAATFSFYPGKNLGALGDAGAIATQDEAIARRARSLRNYGSVKKYIHDEIAAHSRLDELQAALLRAKLPMLERWNQHRTTVADAYLHALADVPRLTLPASPLADVECSWHLFCVRHPRRDALQAHLSEHGIETLIHYPVPPHRSGAFADLGYAAGSFPVTEDAAATLLSLPLGPHMDDAAVDEVVRAVRSFRSSP
jgi:dTDP-3-amino-3,4,6-trideoxy-alpha-D-glucose transaminase